MMGHQVCRHENHCVLTGTDLAQSDSFSFPAPLPLSTADSWYRHQAAFLPVDRAPLPRPQQGQEDVPLPAEQKEKAPIESRVLQPGGQLVFGTILPSLHFHGTL